MKKIIAIICAVVVGLAVVYVISAYNSLARASQEVDAAWSNVETQYQRRSDLVPNLVNTVKGYAAHEQQTLTEVVEARSAATALTIEGNNMTAENIKAYVAAQQNMTSAIGRLIAIAENYPDLKANQNFLELQAQLEGTENRIAVSRKGYNEAVKAFNTKTVTFPSNMIASMFGFSPREFFASTETASTAPQVVF